MACQAHFRASQVHLLFHKSPLQPNVQVFLQYCIANDFPESIGILLVLFVIPMKRRGNLYCFCSSLFTDLQPKAVTVIAIVDCAILQPPSLVSPHPPNRRVSIQEPLITGNRGRIYEYADGRNEECSN